MRIMPHCATPRKRQKQEYRNQPISDTIDTRHEDEALLPFWAPGELPNCQIVRMERMDRGAATKERRSQT